MILDRLVIACFVFFVALSLRAQHHGSTFDPAETIDQGGDDKQEEEMYREIIVRIRLPGVGVLDVITYQRDTTLYLPVIELFSFLHIPLEDPVDPAKIAGVFRGKEASFLIDTERHVLIANGQRYPLSVRDFILGHAECYLSTEMLSRVFGLSALYDEEQLLVTLHSERPLPVQLEKEREARRRELHLRGAAEGTMPREYPRERKVLGGAMMDWNVGVTHADAERTRAFMALRFGGEVLGGDLTTSFRAQNDQHVAWSELPWRWRYVAEAGPWFRQANIGWMTTTLGRQYSMRGISIGNEWVYSRTDYGMDVIDGVTDPHADVELYRNRRLYDIVVADSSGSYRFDVPLKFGTNQFEIREYRHAGDIRRRSIRSDVPRGYVPPGEWEYHFSGGISRLFRGATIGEGMIRHGVSRSINLGGGMQYWDGIPGSGVFPALSFESRPFHGFHLSALHLQDLMTTSVASLALAGNYRVEATYRHYATHPFFNSGRLIDESRLNAHVPLPSLPLRTALSMSGRLLRYASDASSIFLRANLTTGTRGIHLRLSTYASHTRRRGTSTLQQFESIFQIHFPFWRSFLMHGGTILNHDKQDVRSLYLHCSYHPSPIWDIALRYNHNFYQRSGMLQLDVQLRLPYARVRSTGNAYAQGWQTTQRAAGGIAWDNSMATLLFSDRSWVGQSGMTLLPFLDQNGNGYYDETETLLTMPVVTHVDRSRTLPADDDVSRFVAMEAYNRYDFTVEAGTLADPLLVPDASGMSVVMDPNQFKAVHIPVFSGGEIGGEIRRVHGTDTLLQDGVRIWFRPAAATRPEIYAYSFSDGSYAHFGLKPGQWIVYPDSIQLHRRGLVAHPARNHVTLQSLRDGDFITGIDFLLVESELPSDIEVPVESLPPIVVLEAEEDIEPPLYEDPDQQPSPEADTRAPVVAEVETEIPFQPVRPGSTEHVEIDLAPPALDSTATAFLDRLIETVRLMDSYTISVQGHSDNFGSFTENQQRSEERARRIREYLTMQGIPRSRIKSEAFGSRQPRAPNTTAEGRRQNNRADVTLRGSIPSPRPSPEEGRPPDVEVDTTVFIPPAIPEESSEHIQNAFTILINLDRAGIAVEGRQGLDQLVADVTGRASYIIQVEGHSDNFGSFTENQQRSELRAARVVDYLLRQGIQRSRMQVQSFGARRPVAPNRTAAGRRLNNRVEVRLLAQ